ncbi:diguanylate cyclase, partial [Pseudomonas syringae pv. tagetis]
MEKHSPTSPPGTPITDMPAAPETLLALMHAQAEVARLTHREQLFSSLLLSLNAV